VKPEPSYALEPEAPVSLGLMEVLLPLWHRRWRLLIAALVCAVLGFGLSLLQPVKFTGRASFLVQAVQRPSQASVQSTLPALAGLMGGGVSAIDQHVAILRSQALGDRIIQRFDLMRIWDLKHRAQAQQRLARSLSVVLGRREGLVEVIIQDDRPDRAAAMANEYVEELRNILRGFAQDEAKQRRAFYDTQLTRARQGLEEAQRKLQASGYDRAALRAEPRGAAESYARLQAEVAASEVRLAAARRVRAEGSNEVQQMLSEQAALRAQLARMEVPRDDGPGSFVARLREFRFAETLVDALARQADAARVDEAAEALPMQWLDRAQPPGWPSSPRPVVWAAAGLLLGLVLQAAWVLTRHRGALARQDPRVQERLAFVRALLVRR
jgi:uncharacterized protein involved in exopolysaccharide biosynthesis